jgi:hypothetical protein
MYNDDWRKHQRYGGGLGIYVCYQISFTMEVTGAGPNAGEWVLSIPVFVVRLDMATDYTQGSSITSTTTFPARLFELVTATDLGYNYASGVGPYPNIAGGSIDTADPGYSNVSLQFQDDVGWVATVSMIVTAETVEPGWEGFDVESIWRIRLNFTTPVPSGQLSDEIELQLTSLSYTYDFYFEGVFQYTADGVLGSRAEVESFCAALALDVDGTLKLTFTTP